MLGDFVRPGVMLRSRLGFARLRRGRSGGPEPALASSNLRGSKATVVPKWPEVQGGRGMVA
eukprot:13459468-Alexandrium_andersonii.AAC.1